MSYKRAWELIEALNGAFGAPLVETSNRGHRRRRQPAHGSGRRRVLACYRRIEAAAMQASADELHTLGRLLVGEPGR